MKIGLVLAGGGAKGAYQIGAFKALKELKIDKYISVLAGTSIGALNAMLLMQDDLELSESIWGTITREKILPIDEKDLNKKSFLISLGLKNINFIKKHMPKMISGGNISREGLDEIMEVLDFNKIKENKMVCYAACTEVPSLMPKYFKVNDYEPEDIKKILLATSALPMIYECEEIECTKYLDGGIVDNIPIQPVYGEGCDIIIIIHLSKETPVNKKMYPNTNIIEITPSEIEEGVLDGTLDFTIESAKKRMKLGYDNTMEMFQPIFKIFEFIKQNETAEELNKKVVNKEICENRTEGFVEGIKHIFAKKKD